jgi:DNA-damage-inducible protein J
MSNADTCVRARIDADTKKRTKKRRLPVEVAVPNARTKQAMAELDGGGGKRFATVEALMADMVNDED